MFATNIWTWFLIFLGVVFIVQYNWKRRFMYYYSSKMPGPVAWPIIGNVPAFFGKQDPLNVAMDMLQTYPPVFRTWFGKYLYIFTSRPEDAEVILNRFLEKASIYDYFLLPSKNVLVTAPVSTWKKLKKIINPTFHTKVVESFHETFVKYSKDMSKVLEDSCGREETDLFSKFWEYTMTISFETLLDVSSNKTKFVNTGISGIERNEQIMIQRILTPQLHIPFLWKLSTLYKEAQIIKSKGTDTVGEVLDMKAEEMAINKRELDDDASKRKCYISLLLDALHEGEKLTRGETIDEMIIMVTAASETTAVTITSAMLALALYPDVQERIYQELTSILGDDIRDPTAEDMKKMEYLERVIKETMRLFPAIPFIVRSVDKDVPLDPYVFPAGSDVVIPILHIHRRAELWPDPFKFDPNRFLPEEVKKRHPCAFIPFSVGARNCIGFKYGMESMKVILAAIVKSVKIKALNYKSLEDIQLQLYLIAKPKGYKVSFERRI